MSKDWISGKVNFLMTVDAFHESTDMNTQATQQMLGQTLTVTSGQTTKKDCSYKSTPHYPRHSVADKCCELTTTTHSYSQ